MDTILQLCHQFQAQHPMYSYILALMVGTFAGPRILAWIEDTGLPKIEDWAEARQEFALRRLGLSESQIAVLEQHEAADLRREADRLDAKARARLASAAIAGAAESPKA